MLEISFSIQVAQLSVKLYSYFQLKADCDNDWATELIPGNIGSEIISFKTNLCAPDNTAISIALFGAKTEFGVVKDAELIESAVVSGLRGKEERVVEFTVGKRALKVATVNLMVQEFHFKVRDGEKVSSFRLVDRFSNDLNLVLFKNRHPKLLDTRRTYLHSLESFYSRDRKRLANLTNKTSDLSTLLINRLFTINGKRIEWINYLLKAVSEDAGEASTCVLEADKIISETTIKIHCFIKNNNDPRASHIPTVHEISRAYEALSSNNFERQLSYCTSAIAKDLEGFKKVAKALLHREESISQVKALFQNTKGTLTQARDVIFNLRRVCKDTYGPNSPQVEILDNCIGKLTFIVRKSVVHVADGPYMKNVTFLYDQIIEAIKICMHILETFQPIQFLPPYLNPAFVDNISNVLALFEAMIDKWTENSELKAPFKDSILKFIKKHGFIYRVYISDQALIDLETIQALRQVKFRLHSREEDPNIKAVVENVKMYLSIPVDFEYADETCEISILPIILVYTSTPNIKPSRSIRILNLQLIEALDLLVQTIPHFFRPNWVTILISDNWISIKELTCRVRWIEHYLSKTNHGVFGCCWTYNHRQGDFSENEMEVLEREAGVMIS